MSVKHYLKNQNGPTLWPMTSTSKNSYSRFFNFYQKSI